MGRFIISPVLYLAAVCCIAVLYEQLNMDLILGVNGAKPKCCDIPASRGHGVFVSQSIRYGYYGNFIQQRMLQRDHAETKIHYVARGDARPGAHGPSGLFHGPRGPAGPPGSRGVNGNNNSGAPGPLDSDGSSYGPSGKHGQRGESE